RTASYLFGMTSTILSSVAISIVKPFSVSVYTTSISIGIQHRRRLNGSRRLPSPSGVGDE
ncbi:MAG: hypothetical protein PHD74_10670, partial [Candidatus Krumholzibacteria bacterium]|nr:hypothetical protein [Candidatus Krumholzibacteria bacterium]